MKELLPVIAAGGTFTASALLGLALGIVLAGRTGSQLWVFGGLLVGLGLGGYMAYRTLQRSA